MKNEWWKDFYDEHLAHMLLHPATGDDSRQTSDFLSKVLQLSPGDHIFDQCCGTGRLAIELAERGHQVTGIDLAEGYIAEAQSVGKTGAEFAVADAFLYHTPTPCDSAINWWTSFGYAREDSQNIKMVKQAFLSLKPGGRFAMDYMNSPNLYRQFLPTITTTKEGDDGPTILKRESRIDLHTGQLHKVWNYKLPNGKTIRHETSTRLYSPDQLVSFFAQVGFSEIKLYGEIDGSGLSLESPRCIIVGRRPV
ncbi:MAG: ubiquinone/menaquinone biosynthesis C-methylase UbiE [Akkermansiaceae bacterium]|jgi:ubiquinone/menaquinone biosynthesis C-methylase UbiE